MLNILLYAVYMAEYNFETAPPNSRGDSQLEITVDRRGAWDRLGHPFSEVWGYVNYLERSRGRLTISDIEDLEAEALKRGLLVSCDYNPDLRLKHSPILSYELGFGVEGRIGKMQEIEGGTFTAGAALNRYGRRVIDKSGELMPVDWYDEMKYLRITSFHANLARVCLAAVSDMRADFGENRTGIADAANRMQHEILEVVVPELVAVHKLSVDMLAEEAKQIAA